jgi:hypothetical protein
MGLFDGKPMPPVQPKPGLFDDPYHPPQPPSPPPVPRTASSSGKGKVLPFIPPAKKAAW